MKNTPLNRSKKHAVKTEGSALLIGIFLSGLMLTIGVMAARLAVREVQFSADLFLAEKAYLSAESGVEKALWHLKDNPLSHVKETNNLILGKPDTTVSIRNLIKPTTDGFALESFEFTLAPLASQKWRFRKDTDDTVSLSEAPINSGTLKVEAPGEFFWRFLCEETSGGTIALQGQTTGNVANLMNTTGTDDDGNTSNFDGWSVVDKNTCYVSIQNLETTPSLFTFSGATMAPHAAHIHAVGLHGSREKHIRFDYAQKTLGSLFDFSFLHSEGGL